MNKYYLSAKNACRYKYRHINLRLRYSNNVDKNFHQKLAWYGILYFYKANQKQSSNYYSDMDFNPANRQLLRWNR